MPKLVVVGASQGGVPALKKLIAGLKSPFPAPILVAQHIGATQSMLPAILSEIDGLDAAFAHAGQPLQAGCIHVAPPDRHMLVTDGHLELSHGPRENWARPAIDPLFRSAAQAYGADAIGVILSGRLNDGTAGLFEIKRQGGVAIVQAPADAEAPDMPQSALENVAVDYCLPVADMPRLLTRLAGDTGASRLLVPREPCAPASQQIIEPSAQTCPECGGAMRQQQVGSLTRFRCHIGHAMTAEILAAQQAERLEGDLSALLRMLNERTALCRDIAERHRRSGNLTAARLWQEAAEQAAAREKTAALLAQSEWHHPEAEGAAREMEDEMVEDGAP